MSVKLLFFPLSVVVLIWSFISYTKPTWDTYQAQKKELVTLSKEKTELANGLANIEKAVVEYEALSSSSTDYVYNAIPKGIDNDNLVAEINKNASQGGVLITKISLSEKKAKIDNQCRKKQVKDPSIICSAGADTTEISLAIVGSYQAIKDFLGRLDAQNRIVTVGSLSFSVPKNKDEDVEGETVASSVDIVSANINLSVYQKSLSKKKILSKSLKSDAVLGSLLKSGLSEEAMLSVEEFITSDIFRPVQVEGAGKENLFEQSN